MPRVQQYFARGRLIGVFSRSGKWEFQLAGSGWLPLEGRFWIEPGPRYPDNVSTLLYAATGTNSFDIVVKTAAPISPQTPALVESMRAVRRPPHLAQAVTEARLRRQAI